MELAIELLEAQIAAAEGQGGYVLALLGALCLPDIAGAMGSDDGRAAKDKYIGWYDKWVEPLPAEDVRRLFEDLDNPNVPTDLPHFVSGADCWAFRCVMLHQGRTDHDDLSYDRIMFLETGTRDNGIHFADVGGPLLINLATFCGHILEGTRRWHLAMAGTESYERNRAASLRRYPEAFGRLRFGAPIIT